MLRNALLLLALLPLTACVQMPKYVALDAKATERVSEIEVISSVAQDEVIVVAENPGVSAAAGGGLLMALIDSEISKGRQEEIQKTIEPFYGAVDDLDFRRVFWDTLIPGIKSARFGKLGVIQTTPRVIGYRDRNDRITKLPPGKGFMYFTTVYSFSRDFGQFSVVTAVDLWVGGQQEPAYSNVFRYESSRTGANPIQQWSRESGKLYRAAVGESAKETARMLDLDLKYPRIEGIDKGLSPGVKSVSIPRSTGTPPTAVTGTVLDDQAARVVVRHSDGRLYSLPR